MYVFVGYIVVKHKTTDTVDINRLFLLFSLCSFICTYSMLLLYLTFFNLLNIRQYNIQSIILYLKDNKALWFSVLYKQNLTLYLILSKNDLLLFK